MASSKEVLKDWLKEGKYVSQEEIDSLYGMQALTEELAEKRFQEKYGKYLPWSKAEQIESPVIPTLDVILDYIPKDDGDKRSKYEIFIQDFPKKLPEWKKKFTKNPSWGQKGWNTVYDVWKKVSNWQMQDDIVKARTKAMDDAEADYGLFTANVPGSSFITKVLFPRATEHIANTGDFTTKDILADIAENAAMSIPGAAFTGLAGRGLARVAPRVVNWASKPGSNFASSALKGAGKMSGNILGNAVVPFASEAMDAALYGDNDEGMEQRADFSIGDALLGTAINQGVNRGLMRMVGPMIDRYSPGGMARGGMLKARQFLESLGEPFSKKGDDFANAARLTDELKNIREKGNLRPEDVDAFVTGSAPGASTTADEAFEAFRKASVLDDIDKGNLQLLPKEVQMTNAELNHKATINSLKGELNKTDNQIAELTRKADDIQSQIDGLGPEASDDVRAALYNQLAENDALLDKRLLEKEKLTNALRKDYSQNNVTDLFTSPQFNTTLPYDEVLGILDKNIPEFTNYAKWHGTGPGSATVLDRVGNYLNQGVPAWGVNKLGTESASDALLSQTPGIKKVLKSESTKAHQAPKDRQASADVLKVIGNGGLTAEDQKYLNAIAKNPEIMRIGYKDDPNGFKMWLLERGNELLMGTRAARPTFGVE